MTELILPAETKTVDSFVHGKVEATSFLTEDGKITVASMRSCGQRQLEVYEGIMLVEDPAVLNVTGSTENLVVNSLLRQAAERGREFLFEVALALKPMK